MFLTAREIASLKTRTTFVPSADETSGCEGHSAAVFWSTLQPTENPNCTCSGKVERQLVGYGEVEPLLRHAWFHVNLVGYANHWDVWTSECQPHARSQHVSAIAMPRTVIANFFVPPQWRTCIVQRPHANCKQGCARLQVLVSDLSCDVKGQNAGVRLAVAVGGNTQRRSCCSPNHRSQSGLEIVRCM